MDLAARLRADMISAMKAGDKDALAAIRFVSSEVGRAAKDAGLDQATDEIALAVLEREAKRRRDTASASREGGREDLAAEADAELAIIAAYLPEQLTDEELQAIVDEVVQADMQLGSAIKEVSVHTKGKADGSRVAGMVRKALEGRS